MASRPPHVPAQRSPVGAGRRCAGTLLALAALLGAPVRPGAAELVPVQVAALAPRILTDAGMALAGDALELRIHGHAQVGLPLTGAELLELDLVSDSIFTLFWSTGGASRASPYTRPVRYVGLPVGATTVRLDLATTAGWSLRSNPMLVFNGTGRVLLKGVRYLPATVGADEAESHRARAILWGPEPIWHTTINFLEPPLVSRTSGRMLPELLALGALLVAAIAALGTWRRWGARRALAVALASGCLAAAAAGDAHLLARFLPAFRLAPVPDPERRIRDHYYFDAEFGALAALARATLGPEERVGVFGQADDWFGPQTVCFNLAPRPCVKIQGAGPRFPDIAGVPRLALDEVDAVVVTGRRDAPEGFQPVASVSPFSFIARRP